METSRIAITGRRLPRQDPAAWRPSTPRNGWKLITRQLFLYAASQPWIRGLVTGSASARRLASRFVAGENIEEVLAAMAEVNRKGLSATLDLLGENVTAREQSLAARDVYLHLLDEIHQRGLDSNVSVKLTQMGLDLSGDFCFETVSAIATHAAQYGSFVRIDMEGSAYTEKTLSMVRRLRQRHENVGAVIQAYLQRSEKDVVGLLTGGVRIRLCKGAYQEPPSVAFERKADVDRNFIHLMQLLLDSGLYHGIATHDPRMIVATQRYSESQGIPPGAFEFQMLYGVRRDLQQSLRRQGWGMRVYMPFGAEWFPYFMRRLAERPANALFVARSMLKG